jgi:hypothetical protein
VNVNSLIESLSQLPIGILYLAIAGISAIENIFPPFPAMQSLRLEVFSPRAEQRTRSTRFSARGSEIFSAPH